MYRFLFLISLVLCCPVVAEAHQCDRIIVVHDPQAKTSYRRWWPQPDGCSILLIVKKPKRVVSNIWCIPSIKTARFSISVYSESTPPRPVVIANPYVKE